MDIKQLQANLAITVRVHQNSTCGAAENIGTAAKPNGIMHEPHLSVTDPLAARQDALQSIVIRRREGFRRKDQNSSVSSSEGYGSSVKRIRSADAGHLGNATMPCTGDGSTWNNIEGINSDKSIDSGRPSLALRSSSCRSVVQEPEVGSSYVDRNLEHNISLVVCSSSGLKSQGGDSSKSTSANQQILDLNLALAFQEKLSDPRITSILKQKGRHTDRELANLLQDKGLDPNFAVMLKENGLDPKILALLQRSSLDADREHRDSNPPVTNSNNVEDVLPNHISFSAYYISNERYSNYLSNDTNFAKFRHPRKKLWLYKVEYVVQHKPLIPPLAGPAPGAIPSMSLQQFQPMLPSQQAQPYGSESSQQFFPLGHANVAMSQPSQIQFPQPMQQVTGRPVVGMHSMPQGPPTPHDFQGNLPMLNNHMPGSGDPNLPLSSSYNQVNADSSSFQYQTQINDHRFPSGVQPWMPISNHNVNSETTVQKTGELAAPLVVLVTYMNSLMSASETLNVLSMNKWWIYGSLVSAHGAKSSPIAVSPAANLPTIMASESSSLFGKVSSPMIETVEMKNSSEPASPAVANSEKIGIVVTLGNSVAPPVSETTTTQDAVVYGDGFSSKNGENVKKDAAVTEIRGATPVELGPLVYKSKTEAKSAFKTLPESVNIRSDCMWDQYQYLSQKKTLEAEERRVKQKKAWEDFRIMLEDCKELSPSSRWSKAISIFEHDERFKAVEQAKDREDLFEDYVEELEKKVKLLLQNFLEHAKALEEQKCNKVEYLEFLKSCDFIMASSQWRKVQDCFETDERCSRLERIERLEIFQEYIRDLESEEEEQRKWRMEKLRKAERKNRDEFQKLMEEHVPAGILNAKINWRDYCIKIKDFAAYLAVSSNTSGSTRKDLFTDVMDELEKQVK
ncbi:hypothetical protein T459_22231 [Capsicum annuum]|uniref:FF domain-containing protein n=1 Tax=Capsicum annuum TaxID=4072 RepID=A0A2G2YYY9_CAPAN|nr:hypothetical protein T459_22231 [Capsicum annuum]